MEIRGNKDKDRFLAKTNMPSNSLNFWEDFPARLAHIRGFEQHLFSVVGETGSTNDDLKRDWRSPNSPPGRVHVAGHQKAGRGLYGRTWDDQPSTEYEAPNSLLFSFSWKTAPDKPFLLPLPLLTGIAIHRALMKFWEHPPFPWIKWPNDLWVARGKLGGVLVEAMAHENGHEYVLGIGINLQGKPEPRDYPAAAIRDFGIRISPAQLLESILIEWETVIGQKDHPELVGEFHSRAAEFFAGSIRFAEDDGTMTLAKPIELDRNGGLWIQPERKGRRLIDDARRLFLVF